MDPIAAVLIFCSVLSGECLYSVGPPHWLGKAGCYRDKPVILESEHTDAYIASAYLVQKWKGPTTKKIECVTQSEYEAFKRLTPYKPVPE